MVDTCASGSRACSVQRAHWPSKARRTIKRSKACPAGARCAFFIGRARCSIVHLACRADEGFAAVGVPAARCVFHGNESRLRSAAMPARKRVAVAPD